VNQADFFNRDVADVARDMIGATFLYEGIGGRIVETEAYAPDDPASHSFAGKTLRNAAMFGSPGDVYVYRIYGMHFCANIVCRPGSAVLLRALEPLVGLAIMRARRGGVVDKLLCTGPGRLCSALGLDLGVNALSVSTAPFEFIRPHEHCEPLVGPRIGITKAADKPWRFGLKGSAFLSRRF
jgi:DNA-3-methyladenine glycosylase